MMAVVKVNNLQWELVSARSIIQGSLQWKDPLWSVQQSYHWWHEEFDYVAPSKSYQGHAS